MFIVLPNSFYPEPRPKSGDIVKSQSPDLFSWLLLPGHDGKVAELRDGDAGHEAGRDLVAEHDGDEDEAPDEEAEGEEQPLGHQQLGLEAGAHDQQDVGQGVP